MGWLGMVSEGPRLRAAAPALCPAPACPWCCPGPSPVGRQQRGAVGAAATHLAGFTAGAAGKVGEALSNVFPNKSFPGCGMALSAQETGSRHSAGGDAGRCWLFFVIADSAASARAFAWLMSLGRRRGVGGGWEPCVLPRAADGGRDLVGLINVNREKKKEAVKQKGWSFPTPGVEPGPPG